MLVISAQLRYLFLMVLWGSVSLWAVTLAGAGAALATVVNKTIITCPAKTQSGVCATGDALALVDAATEDECCRACALHKGCTLFNFKLDVGNRRPCALKGPSKRVFRGACNTSAVMTPPKPGPSPPSPPPPPPSPIHNSSLKFHPMFLGGAVLQMDMQTRVWGFAAPGDTSVSILLDGVHVVSHVPIVTQPSKSGGASANHTWMAVLPPQTKGYRRELMVVAAPSGSNASTRVSFGHVILCSGQSNMGMAVGYGPPDQPYPGGPNRTEFSADNGTAETRAAGRYQGKIYLRLDNGPYSSWDGQSDRRTTYWTDVTPDTLGRFSAVCWYSGKALYEMALEASETPLGLVRIMLFEYIYYCIYMCCVCVCVCVRVCVCVCVLPTHIYTYIVCVCVFVCLLVFVFIRFFPLFFLFSRINHLSS